AAKKGKKITAKELRSTIKQRKQLKSAAVEEELPAQPEIVTIIARDASESAGRTSAVPEIHPRPTLQAIASPAKVPNVKPGWYRVGQDHLLFCGDTASRDFVQQMPPAKLAIAATGSDWDHDWLIDQVDSVVVVPQDEFTVEKLEKLLQMLSKSQDWVVLPWLPQAEMLGVAHRLGRRVYAGDVDVARCRSAIAASGLAAKATKLGAIKVAGQVG
ncbi:MAG: site-specific DNA-methyltransferase, partial [Cyanobacteria bacterium J06629_9]